MKKYFKVVGLVMAMLFVLTASAMATTITYADNTRNWTGYTGDPRDFIGSPDVYSLSVTFNANNYLESISVSMRNRLLWDGLFINANAAGESYENWDYYVESTRPTYYVPSVSTLYSVGAGGPGVGYQYILINNPAERYGHPAGISSGITADTTGLLSSVVWQVTNPGTVGAWDDVGVLTYTFDPNRILLGQYVIGYAPYCANDVILTPEPSILMLLGLGLLGLAGVRRRFNK